MIDANNTPASAATLQETDQRSIRVFESPPTARMSLTIGISRTNTVPGQCKLEFVHKLIL
jgi:hypothetical protein